MLILIYNLNLWLFFLIPLLELSVRNSTRYPQSATHTLIRYQPSIHYLLPCTSSIFLSLLFSLFLSDFLSFLSSSPHLFSDHTARRAREATATGSGGGNGGLGQQGRAEEVRDGTDPTATALSPCGGYCAGEARRPSPTRRSGGSSGHETWWPSPARIRRWPSSPHTAAVDRTVGRHGGGG